MIDWTQRKTAQQRAHEQVQQARDTAIAQRMRAYREESDPLRAEAEYDALVAGVAPDYSKWQARVREIKQRYPVPTLSGAHSG